MYLLTHFFIRFITISLVISKSAADESLKASDPGFLVDGQNLNQNLGVKICISFFLVVAYCDLIFQTILFLYAVCGLVSASPKKLSDYLCAILCLTLYVILRVTLAPYLIAFIPWEWAPTLPTLFVEITLYLNVSMFIFVQLLAVLACLYFMLFIGVTGKKLPGSIVDRETGQEPMVIVLMPIYNEDPDALFRAVESAVRCNYSPDRLHIFLAFDEASESPLYFALLRKLKVLSKEVSEEIKSKLKFLEDTEELDKYHEIFPPRLEWYVEGVRVTICRFPHEGKSPTQAKAFKVINENYGNDEATSANTLILFIDSDIILHENAIHNFVQPAVANPKIKGMTGLISCRTSRKLNFYQYLQDAEYIDGQMFSRSAEAILGTLTCLPGALTLIRLNALQVVAPKYFIEFDKRRTLDFHRFHLGEDRYMTYLLTQESDGPYQVKFISNATCKTDAPDTFSKLLKQRRRWFLGEFANDVSNLISAVMWTKVPAVVLVKLCFYSSKGVEWIFPAVIISLASNQTAGLALYLLVGIFALRYFLLCLNAFIMTRNKVCVSYLFLFFLSPIFNWMVTLYAVWTWSVRSWGGPRTDGHGEETVSPINVLEEAMAHKEANVGRTRRSIAQIQTISKVIYDNLKEASDRSSASSETRRKDLPPLKKYVPFPYEAEFLGGGGFDSIKVTLTPPAPRRVEMQIQSSHTLNLKTHKLVSEELPYLFGSLNTDTQIRASSFRLNTEGLAKFGGLAPEKQRDSSFNIRLSQQGSPKGTKGSLNGESTELNVKCSLYGPESKASSVSNDMHTDNSSIDLCRINNNNEAEDNSSSSGVDVNNNPDCRLRLSKISIVLDYDDSADDYGISRL